MHEAINNISIINNFMLILTKYFDKFRRLLIDIRIVRISFRFMFKKILNFLNLSEYISSELFLQKFKNIKNL